MTHYDYDYDYDYDDMFHLTQWYHDMKTLQFLCCRLVADPLIELAGAEEKYWIGLTVFLVLSHSTQLRVVDLISLVLTGILSDPEIDRLNLNKIFIDYILHILKTVFNGA